MTLTFLGTGTSQGIPVAPCSCNVCQSEDPKNKRDRVSVWLQKEGFDLIIDTPPEFRLQALREGIQKIDAALITHGHADHLHGLDDLRPFSYKREIPLYSEKEAVKSIKERFAYAFKSPEPQGGGAPRLRIEALPPYETRVLGPFQLTPLPVIHGRALIYAYKIDNIAYITDCSAIPPETWPHLIGLDTLIIGALRYRPHNSHFNVEKALEVIKKISPKRAYLTHLCHDIDHSTLEKELPPSTSPAWDGLKI